MCGAIGSMSKMVKCRWKKFVFGLADLLV